jgi:hypothetical protein
MDMSKNKLIFIGVCAVLLFIAVVFAVVSLFTAGDEIDEYVDKKPKPAPDTTIAKRVPYGGTDPILSESTGSLTVFEPEGGWQLVESADGRFQIRIPSDWVVAKESFYGAMLEAYDKEGLFWAMIYSESNLDGKSLSDWVTEQNITGEQSSFFVNGYPGILFYQYRAGENKGIVLREVISIDGDFYDIFCGINKNVYFDEDIEFCKSIIGGIKFF